MMATYLYKLLMQLSGLFKKGDKQKFDSKTGLELSI